MPLEQDFKALKKDYMDVFSSVKGQNVLRDIESQGFIFIPIYGEDRDQKEGKRQLALMIRDMALSPIEPEQDNSNEENS